MEMPPPTISSPPYIQRQAETVADDIAAVAALDVAYQAAVKANDVAAMDAILHAQYALVLGNGTIVSRDDLLREAASGDYVYEVQDEDPGTQTVRVWGDTAVVTARLRIKGEYRGAPFDRTLWFSDTYVRTEQGWRYAFAQASLPLPERAEQVLSAED
ncbi:ketosteroid isomerase-like protein [Phenylobacterium haematophilum]|uniref:Ketosteroid isomerase-like protein n=1 Tax=Phenylobacterium haematophilum TaxID=98513 RepID=A0A839ZY16_9CAUL|nr:nuclear transport factor 2 family protein [Phenylobacterium haematophilum]MBB3890629.1 ketosteroid isomerase-like protein [Phenylobacterium haematophilum]